MIHGTAVDAWLRVLEDTVREGVMCLGGHATGSSRCPPSDAGLFPPAHSSHFVCSALSTVFGQHGRSDGSTPGGTTQ
jgi:hypothetical protein